MATTISAELAPVADSQVSKPRTGFFKRVLAALIEARERSAEREIERYIAMNGGVLTDSIERDLSRTFGRPAGNRL